VLLAVIVISGVSDRGWVRQIAAVLNLLALVAAYILSGQDFARA